MIELILAFFLALFPGYNNTTPAKDQTNTHVTTMDDPDDGGGETGHLPNQPPPPPPPPGS